MTEEVTLIIAKKDTSGKPVAVYNKILTNCRRCPCADWNDKYIQMSVCRLGGLITLDYIQASDKEIPENCPLRNLK